MRAHPQLAEQYQILSTIGRGAQGTVYAARDLRTQMVVAIKALSFREMADWKASELFMREIALLKSMQIQGTPRYIDAIDATDSPDPYYFLVQDFIPGEPLQAKLDRGKTFSAQEVIAIALAIIPILEKLRTYSPPIVHRDIKPSNIMMTPNGDIYLIDFGAAMFSERRTGGSTFAGTAGYMAPEQCMGTSTPDSDVYGLGATLIHLLTGIAPYKIQMMKNAKIVPKKKKTRRFAALLRKPFTALAGVVQKRKKLSLFLSALRKPFSALRGALRKRWRAGRKSAFPCAMTLRFKPHLPEETPQWLIELLELMVSPYPNQRVKDLDYLIHSIRVISGAKLDGHSVHSSTAARLRRLNTIKYQFIIPEGFVLLGMLITFLATPTFIALTQDKSSTLPPMLACFFLSLGLAAAYLFRLTQSTALTSYVAKDADALADTTTETKHT